MPGGSCGGGWGLDGAWEGVLPYRRFIVGNCDNIEARLLLRGRHRIVRRGPRLNLGASRRRRREQNPPVQHMTAAMHMPKEYAADTLAGRGNRFEKSRTVVDHHVLLTPAIVKPANIKFHRLMMKRNDERWTVRST